MIARLSIGHEAPEQMETIIAEGLAVDAAVRQMDGCREVHLLVDRKSGKTVSFSFWESEEDMRKNEAVILELRKQWRSAPATTETYEVID